MEQKRRKSPKGSKPKPAARDALPAQPAAEAEPEVSRPRSSLAEDRSDKAGADPGAALVPANALQRYLAEIRRTPLLSREEEHALAVRYREKGDLDAAYHLVSANLRLVVKIAMEYQSVYLSILDLIQEGNIGLMQAVKQYNPYRDVKLSSYAAWWIRAFILRYIINNWRLVKIGTTRAQRKLFFNLKKERERLEALGYDASPRLLAARLDVSEKDVEEMSARMGAPDLALDEPLGGESSGTFLDLLSDQGEGPEAQMARVEARERAMGVIREIARALPPKEQAILERRLLAEEPQTLQEIGDSFGITKERTRQLEARLLRKLRDELRARMGDSVPEAEATLVEATPAGRGAPGGDARPGKVSGGS